MNRFAGLPVDDDEICNKKEKRKLNKILRQIDKLKKKTKLSPEEQIKVDKEEEIKEKLKQFDEKFKIPKRKSFKKSKLKKKRRNKRKRKKERVQREKDFTDRKQRKRVRRESERMRREREERERFQREREERERKRKRLGIPKDIWNYINNQIRFKSDRKKLLLKYHPDKNKQQYKFNEYTQLILKHRCNNRRLTWTIKEYGKSSRITKERVKELLKIGIQLGITNDIWIYKILPFVIDTHIFSC